MRMGKTMALIGYARVSTTDQDAELQINALKQAGCERIYTDQGVSGTKASRPELDKMLDHLRKGDEVVIWKFDRLGRNTRNMLELIETLEGMGVGFHSITERIDTTGPMGKAMLTIMSAFAQLERDQIVERTKAGLAIAAQNNRHGGRPRKADTAAVARALDLKAKGVAAPEIAKMLDVSRATVYRYFAEGK